MFQLVYTSAAPMPAKPCVPPAQTETTVHQIAYHDAGHTEISETGHTQIRLALQPVIPPPLVDLLPGLPLRIMGHDHWVPLNSVVANVSRECKKWSEGWEWRKETCNGQVTETWWIGEHVTESFAQFLKESESD